MCETLQIHLYAATGSHPAPLLFCLATTKENDGIMHHLLTLAFKHLLPSAETVAVERSFYTKMDLQVLGSK